jgi:hypothetical protein
MLNVFLAIVGVMGFIALLFGVGHVAFAIDRAAKKRTGFHSLDVKHLDAGHKAWNRELFKVLLSMVGGSLLVFAWVTRAQIWHWLTATRQTVRVTSVNYQRSEYTGLTKAPGVGSVRFTAHCFGTCPALGKHDASETAGLYHPQSIISQTEEQ